MMINPDISLNLEKRWVSHNVKQPVWKIVACCFFLDKSALNVGVRVNYFMLVIGNEVYKMKNHAEFL